MYHHYLSTPYSTMYDYDNSTQLAYDYRQNDERFLPILLPFVAGLAIGPLLFNRPYPLRPPYYPVPYYPGMYPYPGAMPGPYPIYGYGSPMGQQQLVTENINIYTQ